MLLLLQLRLLGRVGYEYLTFLYLFPTLIVFRYVHLCTSTYLRNVLFYTLLYIISAALACSSCCWFKISSVLSFRKQKKKKSYLYKYNILGIVVDVVFVSSLQFICIYIMYKHVFTSKIHSTRCIQQKFSSMIYLNVIRF